MKIAETTTNVLQLSTSLSSTNINGNRSMRSVRARPWPVKFQRNGRLSQKDKQRAKKMLTTQRSSAWTKQGEQPGRHLVAKRAGEHGNNDKNFESALARSLKLQSELEAMKRDLRESENRVQELLALDGFGGGIVAGATMTAELKPSAMQV